MYTVVLMAALTGSAEAPDLFFSKWKKHGPTMANGDGNGSQAAFGPLYQYGCAGGYGVHGYSVYGCHGCYGCYGCYGCAGATAGGYNPSQLPINPAPGKDYDTLPAPKPEKSLAPTADQARVVVELPAGARLLVDDQEVKVPLGRKTFATPDLKPGQAYFYHLTVVLKRDGRILTETRKIAVQGGQVVNATFTEDSLVAAANRTQ